MRKWGTADLFPFDSEIEKTARRLRKEAREAAARPPEPALEHLIDTSAFTTYDNPMAEEHHAAPAAQAAQEEGRTLMDYMQPSVGGIHSAIRKPVIAANNFEIKSGTIQMIKSSQFGGLATEDPKEHISNFVELCETFKFNGVTDDAVRLRLFPFSLRDGAKSWLNSLPANSITTWEELCQKFLNKFFPFEKQAKLRNEIVTFAQYDGETLYESWGRFKELLRRCPQHGLPGWMQVQTFYIGLTPPTRNLLNAAAGGAFMNQTEEAAFKLLEDMSLNNEGGGAERAILRRQAPSQNDEAIRALTEQVAMLTRQLQGATLGVNSVAICQWCHGAHPSEACQVGNPMAGECPEQANFVGNNNNNAYGNSYNPSWRNHPNFSWRNNQNAAPLQQALPLQDKSSHLEDLIGRMAEHTTKFMDETKTVLQNQSAQIRSLEAQISQLAMAQNARPQGTLPSNTEINPKEQCNAIVLRGGKMLQEREVLESSRPQEIEEPAVEKEVEEVAPKTATPPQPKVPYPQRLKQGKLEKQFAKFLDVFKKLHINIPFAEALENMPSYAKFLKEILSKKRKLEEFETVALTEECSAVIQRKLPPKLKDPGSFTVPCAFGDTVFEKALCDLGASINLMPLSIYKRLELGEVKPTTITLQMADRTIKHPRGVVEDVLIKVGKFIFPVDFVVLDMAEDHNIPIILGRPFLATGRALIDVQKGELKLRVQGEEETFKVFKATRHPEVDEVFYTEATPPLDPTLPTIQIKKRKRYGKFKQLVDELKERVTAVAEKIKRRRSNISVSTTIKGRRPIGRRHTARP